MISSVDQANTFSTTDITIASFTANELEQFEAYNIKVAARTAIGLGPFIDEIRIRNQTLAQGKYFVSTCGL